VYGNLNAPPAVAYSAIIYSLRCLVTRDIPLNQGCLAPIKVRLAGRNTGAQGGCHACSSSGGRVHQS
jgi:N-methylhydantoinase B/oxoprolinase/acetone carboxylase alpha subunit